MITDEVLMQLKIFLRENRKVYLFITKKCSICESPTSKMWGGEEGELLTQITETVYLWCRRNPLSLRRF